MVWPQEVDSGSVAAHCKHKPRPQALDLQKLQLLNLAGLLGATNTLPRLSSQSRQLEWRQRAEEPIPSTWPAAEAAVDVAAATGSRAIQTALASSAVDPHVLAKVAKSSEAAGCLSSCCTPREQAEGHQNLSFGYELGVMWVMRVKWSSAQAT